MGNIQEWTFLNVILKLILSYSLPQNCDVDYYRIVQVEYDLGPHLNYRFNNLIVCLTLRILRFRKGEKRGLTHLLNEIHFEINYI